MDLIEELARSLPLLLGLIAIALVLVLLGLGRLLARAAEAATDALDSDVSRLESSSEEGDVALVDLRGSSAVTPLRRSFARVDRLLRRLLPGPRPRYQLPWFLSLGPAGAGKTTLLGHTGMILPLGEPDSTAGTAAAGCNWWLFDDAVVLDVAGDFTLQAVGTQSDQAAWRDFLKLLRRHRRRRAGDGVILAVPASELLAFEAADPEAQEALAARAGVLRRKLRRAQEQLGMVLPVYLLITKCDLVPGFRELVAALDADERRQVFGWSSPDPPETPYSAGWVETAWRSVELALARFQLRTFGLSPEDAPAGRDLVAFPAALERLKEPLRIYMNQIFSAGAAAEPFPLRGLYFCGGSGGGAVADVEDSPHDLPAGAGGWTDLPLDGLRGNAHRRVEFVADLVGGKMLYEWSLARPTDRAQRGAHRQAWALKSLLVAALLLGPVALWGGVRLSGERAETLDRQLLSPVAATYRPGPATAGELAERARAALAGAGQVPAYDLQTALLPWGAKADRRLRQAMTSVYRDAVFPAAGQTLDDRLTALAAAPGVAPAAAPAAVTNVESTPEFDLLKQRTASLLELELDVDRFNCFTRTPCTVAGSEVDVFRRLIDSLYATTLGFPTGAARDFYAELLRQVRVEPYSATSHRLGLQGWTLRTGDAMYARLFGDNVLVRDLDRVATLIDRLARQPPAAQEATETYRQLLDAIDQLRDDLARPELAWAATEPMDLGPAFDAWLASVIGSDLLGRTTAAEIRRRGERGFEAFRQILASASSSSGPLLARADGVVQLQLAPEIETLESDLRTLLGESFMLPEMGFGLVIEPPPGTALYWDSEPLGEAVALVGQFESFTAEELASFGALEASTATASRQALEGRLLDLIAKAQDLRDVPNLFTVALERSHLAEQVANLQSVSADLNTLLAAFEAPPASALAGDCLGYCTSRPATGWCLFSAVLETQQRNLLEKLDALLTNESLYTPRDGGFGWWDGTGNLALQAFGVATEDDLKTYLAGQERQIGALAQQFARPVLTALETRDCYGFSSQTEFRRFKVVLSDLADVEKQTPNNAVALVEEFVTATMAAATLENCLTAVTPQGACFAAPTPADLQVTPPCDYFLVRRRELARGIAGRCREITAAEARGAWAAISRSFENRLQGKFPFIDRPSRPLVQETTPADLENFLRVFDRNRAPVEGFLAVAAEAAAGAGGPAWSPDDVAAMTAFMARMSGVRELFTPFMTARAASPAAVPVFDLQVQFRVNQGHEVGGNQIFGWTFEVGENEIAPGDVDPPGRWTFGEPVRLSLAWASNAPTAPQSPRQANARLVERTVVYEHENPWSLVSLLEQHDPPPEYFTGFVDADPVTLVFEIPTVAVVREDPAGGKGSKGSKRSKRSKGSKGSQPDPAAGAAPPPPAPAAAFTTRVFIRVTLMTPDGAKTELPFPEFPTSVPPFAEVVAP